MIALSRKPIKESLSGAKILRCVPAPGTLKTKRSQCHATSIALCSCLGVGSTAKTLVIPTSRIPSGYTRSSGGSRPASCSTFFPNAVQRMLPTTGPVAASIPCYGTSAAKASLIYLYRAAPCTDPNPKCWLTPTPTSTVRPTRPPSEFLIAPWVPLAIVEDEEPSCHFPTVNTAEASAPDFQLIYFNTLFTNKHFPFLASFLF